MKYLQKTLLLLISLLAFRQMAWTQTPISVNNATELQNALNNGTVNLINLGRDINLNSELVSSQTNIIDLNSKTLNCGTHRVRVTAETLVVQSTYDGGTIIGGGADAGCTFYVENGATLDLESGTIMAANRPVTNGGVIYNAGTLEIYGGSISGGNAINGGGVYNAGTMFMGGGTISGNTVSGQGGAIYTTGTLNMQGNPVIVGNTKTNSESNNVYLPSGKVISVTRAFSNGASIGVTMAEGYGIFTTGFNSYNSSNPDVMFSSDNSTYFVTLDGDEASLSASFDEVSYVDRSWDNANHEVMEEVLPCSNFTRLEGSNSNSSTELGDGWYVVYRNVSYKKCLKMVGNVHLILVDGATLTVKDGIYIKKDKTLTVYGQSEGSGKIYAHPDSGPGIGGMKNVVAGHFVVKGGTIDAKAGSKKNSGIGGGNGDSGIQSVTIYGGTVRAEGKKCGAGIGKGLDNNVWEVVTIYGGDVTAIGGENGAGIGGGEDRGNGRVEIWGGTVTAKGGGNGAGIGGGYEGSQDKPIVIHDGTVTATGGYCAAGIGGGCGDKFWSWSDVNGGRGGTVIINGGTVTAKAGKRNLTGAGIGGGHLGTNGDITINGGFVWASTPEDPKFVGAAIGAGDDKKQGGDIVINGGEVVATSYGYGAGIGGGKESKGGNIHITGGEVTAISVYGAGIGGGGDEAGSDGGDGGNITIDGGQIFAMSAAKGAGIGGGNDGNGGTITINGGYVKAVGGYCKYSFFEDHGPTFINLGYDVNPVYSMAAAAVMTIFEELVHLGTFGGAGIGGGDDGKGGTIHINGGTVVAKGGRSSCSAIGKGDGGSSNGKLDIYDDARVFAGNDSIIQLANNRVSACQSNQNATIMPCPHENMTYTIYDNEKHLEHCLNCNHTALKPHVFDNYGHCICGYGLEGHTVTVYRPAESGDGTYESVSYTVGHGRDFQLPESISRIGALQFVGWMQGTPANVQSYVWLDYEPLCAENGIYSNVTSDLSFIARYKEYWNGTGMGSADDPYLIATTDDLDQLSTRVNNGQDFQGRHFLLTANLEYDGTTNNYTTIGTQVGSQYKAFNGTFDGNSHSISGINVYGSNNFIGVFGLLGTQGTITRLTVNDCSFKGNVYVGGIVGANEGTVDHCLVLGGTIQGSDDCGHVIGYNNRRAYFNYYIANDNINGIGENSSAITAPNIFGGNKGYTFSCTEGLVFKYVKGSATGSDDDALIEYDETLYVASGVTVSFEVNCQMGYSLESLLCNGTEITPNDQGVYTITMPEANVVITSTLLQPTFITAGSWDDEANWSNGLPNMGSDVVIAAPATIEGSENVGYITIREGGSITIADGGQLIHTNDVTATLQKEINAYTDDSDGWFTIASPSTYNVPVNSLVTESEYDLYLYHEPTHYWWNSKNIDHGFNALQHRQGYLYANAEDITLSFTGNMLGTNNTVTVPLDYTDAAGSLKGFNLVGNPFTRRLTGSDVIRIGDDTLTTYLIAEGDGELVPYTLAERDIEPGEGFFVQATTTNQYLVFNDVTRGEQTNWHPAYLRIEAGREGCYDRAYVQIGGGNTLRKMSLGEKTPRVSLWHDGKDWSSATIEAATGELPVNFKATENGTYTIRFKVEGLEMDYLHLIDNLTGTDVDLLVSELVEGPATYTFTSKPTDYESRFRLVFSAQSTESANGLDPSFAFLSNGNIIINGEGTLQMIDMMGRIIICRDAKSYVSTAEMVPGVYVLRLIQGDNVKTQKIVIDPM